MKADKNKLARLAKNARANLYRRKINKSSVVSVKNARSKTTSSRVAK